MIDKIILGHNQFFGVNHLDAGRGNERGAYFSQVSRIMEMVNYCYDCGVRGIMMSTHERAIEVAAEIKKDARLHKGMGVYLLVPYAAKYIRKANESGLVNLVSDALRGTTLSSKIAVVWRGGMGVVRKDIRNVIRTMVDFEVAPFAHLNLKAILLHDIPTDLVVGWDVPVALETFGEHVRNKYDSTPGFCTKNLPLLIRMLKDVGMGNPLVMASVNKLGYQVNPSLEALEKCLASEKMRFLAMSTLAAGYLKPDEAYAYLYSLPQVVSTVVGVSRKEHARETFDAIETAMQKARFKSAHGGGSQNIP